MCQIDAWVLAVGMFHWHGAQDLDVACTAMRSCSVGGNGGGDPAGHCKCCSYLVNVVCASST